MLLWQKIKFLSTLLAGIKNVLISFKERKKEISTIKVEVKEYVHWERALYLLI